LLGVAALTELSNKKERQQWRRNSCAGSRPERVPQVQAEGEGSEGERMTRYQQQIERLMKETDKRIGEKNGQEGMYASEEEVRALRQLAIRLERIFGPFPSVDFN